MKIEMKINRNLLVMFMMVSFLLIMNSAYSAKYYVDSIEGDDNWVGKSGWKELGTRGPWQTLSKVNSYTGFNSGDEIVLRAGRGWAEILYVPIAGLTFGKYDDGSNPWIQSTEWMNDNNWVHLGYGVWQGTVGSSYINHFGAVKSGKRVPFYRRYETLNSIWNAPCKSPYTGDKLQNMMNGTFFGPPNTEFFFFKTSGVGVRPGSMNVGVRQHCVVINGMNNTVIGKIDLLGPAGHYGETDANDGTLCGLKIENSSGCVIQNLAISNMFRSAIYLTGSGTTNTIINNVYINDCSTGIYFKTGCGGNHTIKNCTIRDINTVPHETGDNDFIGAQEVIGITVLNCKFNYRGYDGQEFYADDAGLTFWRCENVTVKYCWIYEPGPCGIGLQGSKNCRVFYNVIRDWGKRANPYTGDCYNGINIQSYDAAFPCNDIKNYNNSFSSGSMETDLVPHSSIVVKKTTANNLIIKNNVFLDNETRYELYIHPEANVSGLQIDYNCYYKSVGNPYQKIICYDDQAYSFQEAMNGDWYDDYGFDGNTQYGWPGINIYDFTININSICKDNGVNVWEEEDYNGTSVPQNGIPDIGPFEYK
jgi:Right handed beta helix region